MRFSELQIRTPEGIVFAQPLAGPVSRFLAWVIDAFLWLSLVAALNWVLLLFRSISEELSQAIGVIAIFAFSIGYSIAMEWLCRGQTVGKKLLRLRVVDAEGLRLQWSQVVLRNLLRAVDMLPVGYLLGGATALLNSRCQRLGDLAAGTVVVRVPRISQPDLDQVLPGKFNSLRAHSQPVARLRQRVTAAEASVALQAILRRDELNAESRVRLFQVLAEHFRKRASFPIEVMEEMTDEQFIRNIADLLYRTRSATPAPAVASTP